ncbi:hypothetical protein [Microbacterium sp. NPDC079995]|uniref:hypothetical protein n=1 Tax=unclassified Microbacterium TaxID=2609290 RepID=UPI00344CFE96
MSGIRARVDFRSPSNTNASPLLFGVANEPSRDHAADVYPLLQAAGIRFQRGTIHTNRLFADTHPRATLAQWRSGDASLIDPDTWDWGALSLLTRAKDAGMRTQLNILHTPRWLSHNGRETGLPVDWGVWESIVEQILRRWGTHIDEVDILNEPLTPAMIDIDGSAFATAEDAAVEVYVHTSRAIRRVDHHVRVGGTGEDRRGGDFGSIGPLLRDGRIPAGDLQFASYHVYDPRPADHLQLDALRDLFHEAGRSLPAVYLNEWNIDWRPDAAQPEIAGTAACAYAAGALMMLAEVPGLTGAAFMSALPCNVDLHPDQNYDGRIVQGIYDWHGDHATLRPQADAFRLLSIELGLGAGAFITYESESPTGVQVLGARNSAGEHGLAVVNHGGAEIDLVVEVCGLAEGKIDTSTGRRSDGRGVSRASAAEIFASAEGIRFRLLPASVAVVRLAYSGVVAKD